MTISRVGGLLLAAVLAASVVPVSAQTLGEVARKEQQRRKTSKPTGKVYTNKDLGPGGSAPAPAAEEAAPAATATPEARKDQAEREDPAKTEAYWRDRMKAAQSELERNQVLLEALQARVNALATDFVNRDDPAQRAVIATNRERALQEMAVVRDKIEKLKQQIADIEEEARKAGVPPGWLR